MWQFISVGVAALVYFGIPERNKYSVSNSDKIYSQQLGFPYQYFEEEVLTAEEVNYRLRLIYISLMFGVVFTQAAVPYVSVMFPPSPQVTSIERVINQEIGQSNRAEDRMNPRFITVPLFCITKYTYNTTMP